MNDEPTKFLPPPFLYKKQVFVVPEDNPWENDCLGRKAHAEKLVKILEPVKQPIVMTLSAPYGMGKTTFLKCWKQDLKNESISSVIFNAWETDYSDDAFVAFVASVEKQLPVKDEVKTKFMSAAKSVGGAILKNAPGFVAKVVAKAAIGESGVKALENFDLSEDDAVTLAESIAGDTFKAQTSTENAIIKFRESFADIIEMHCNKRLFIFVDELDRCRPNYSVEVLERIKHIFSVTGVVFVLAVDRQQLLSSIMGVYGPQIDAERYFRKFIDWDYDLPEPSHYQYIRHLFYNIFEFDKQKFFHHGSDLRTGDTTFFQLLTMLSAVYKVSLRDLGQYFTYLNLVLQIIPDSVGFTMEIAVACFIKQTIRGDYKTTTEWTPSGQFTTSPIQAKLEKMLRLPEDAWSQLGGSKSTIISNFLFLFSKQAYTIEGRQVCVSSDFLESEFPDDKTLNNDWLLDCLSNSRHSRLPTVQDGLLILEKYNL